MYKYFTRQIYWRSFLISKLNDLKSFMIYIFNVYSNFVQNDFIHKTGGTASRTLNTSSISKYLSSWMFLQLWQFVLLKKLYKISPSLFDTCFIL
jgi:hypothetical protein